VRYELDDVEHEVACRLVVAADGRASGVRRQLGLDLCQTTPRTMVCGLLVEGLDGWPAHRMSLGTEGDLHHLVFPRRDGVARLYQVFDVAQRNRFSGPDRQRDVLESFRLDCLPQGDAIAATTPAGPVASYPGNDSLVADPVVPGVVLVGDAAGWNDPIIGQGLSIALRDVRLVTEVLAATCDWRPAAFAGYVDERRRRMHRLRTCAELETDVRADFTPAGRRRRAAVLAAMGEDPLVAGALTVTVLAGPDAAPPEAFAPANVARIKALA
jgi:2-polyprenyl-6-methoxyphenol hydroxylase-like FAD-dependent oxidoreductase